MFLNIFNNPYVEVKFCHSFAYFFLLKETFCYRTNSSSIHDLALCFQICFLSIGSFSPLLPVGDHC